MLRINPLFSSSLLVEFVINVFFSELLTFCTEMKSTDLGPPQKCIIEVEKNPYWKPLLAFQNI